MTYDKCKINKQSCNRIPRYKTERNVSRKNNILNVRLLYPLMLRINGTKIYFYNILAYKPFTFLIGYLLLSFSITLCSHKSYN